MDATSMHTERILSDLKQGDIHGRRAAVTLRRISETDSGDSEERALVEYAYTIFLTNSSDWFRRAKEHARADDELLGRCRPEQVHENGRSACRAIEFIIHVHPVDSRAVAARDGE